MRRLLMVAYTFPPVAGVGIERTLKHVTYLPELGWSPVVIAPSDPGYRLVDPATLERVPAGTEVHRARSLEPAHLRRALGRLVRRGRSTGAAAGTADAGAPARRAAERGGARHLLEAAWRAYVRVAFFPDEQLLWAPAAIAAGIGADEADPVDAIYSSGPPWTSHLVAAALQGITGLPWVADFRDPWIGNAYAAPLPSPHRAVRAALERMIVERAAASVFASDGVRGEYAERYPDLAARFTTIHNGYDLADIAASAGQPVRDDAHDGSFRLLFTGSMQYLPEFTLFADGMGLLLARRPELRDRLRVQLVGWLSPEVEKAAARRLPALAPTVERLGFQPKSRTLGLLRGADAALVLLAPGPGREHVASAKLFDYLGLDRRILAVAPPGEVRRILAELDWGVGVDPTPQGFADGVERLLAEPAPDDRPADPDRRFERRTLSRRLAELLDRVADQPSPGGTSTDRRPTPR
jgi:hypothetical protein